MKLTQILVVITFLAPPLLLAELPAKPRTRDKAESRTENLERYKSGTFGATAKSTLGVKVIFQNQQPQGVTVSSFSVDSTAEKAGVQRFDWILEVDGSPVGKIRDRYYELFPHYGRTGKDVTTLLVSYLDSDGNRRYYYPKVEVTPIGTVPVYRALPEDFFTTPEKRKRDEAEFQNKNFARYVIGWGNFEKYAEYELGVDVVYSSNGAEIVNVKSGTAAANANIKVGDIILEVEGAPVGNFSGRVYEVWRQYVYNKNGEVEFCIAIKKDGGGYKYYYPKIKLDDRTTGN